MMMHRDKNCRRYLKTPKTVKTLYKLYQIHKLIHIKSIGIESKVVLENMH